jgi:hypothetical protein
MGYLAIIGSDGPQLEDVRYTGMSTEMSKHSIGLIPFKKVERWWQEFTATLHIASMGQDNNSRRFHSLIFKNKNMKC